MTKYTRLALDMGTTSIGWALLQTNEQGEPQSIIKTGVRIFSSGRDDKTEAPLNQKRQSARSARRRQDRTVQRRTALIKYLVHYGLMPADKSERKKLELLNPYEIRCNALSDHLPVHHIGRALFHINQGRGFKSNRKQQGDNTEGGAIKTAIENTEKLLLENKSKTIGEYLHKRQQQGDPVKIRNISTKNSGFEFEFYRHRQMLEEEFKQIWNKQKSYHPDVYTQDAYDTIQNIIFHQRPLKTKQEYIGKCTLFPDVVRASKALPIYQNFRIVQDMVNLAYIDPDGYDHKVIKESPEVFRQVYETLASGKNQSFKQIKTLLVKDDIIQTEWLLNFESDTRKGFDGNETAHVLSAKKGAPLVDKWDTWDIQKQTDLVKILLDTDTLDDDQALEKLQHDFDLDPDTAERVLNTALPNGYGNLCEKALNDLQPVMLNQGLRYDMAVREVYPDKHHSDLNKGDGTQNKLPYYAKELQEHCTGGHGDPNDKHTKQLPQHLQDIKTWGRIANPTVHIGLVQLQAVVNDIIRVHGKPDFATVEFARDLKNNKKQKDALKKRQKENKENNDTWAKELEGLGLDNNYENRMRMRLWHELDWKCINNRRCPYTGTQISKEMLFNGSVEIEHILPYAKTLDDSLANKTVAMREANRFKGNRSPYEAFKDADGYDWGDIYTRAQHLPKNKAWRFRPNAMEKYADGSFVQDRQLNDTRYLSKVAKKYLGLIVHPNNIHVIPGQLTAMVRGKWGLDEVLHKKADGNVFEKNRNDHRHHAIDAVVIGCTTRGMLQKIATLSGKNHDDGKSQKLLSGFDTPWESFRDDVQHSIENIIVSHKPDPYPQGQLHEETFYGRTKEVLTDKKGNRTDKQQFVIRKPVTSDNFGSEKKINEIRDPLIRQDLLARFTFADRQDNWLQQFIDDTGTHKIRVVQEKPNLIKIGTKYVKGGSNWAIDIFIDPANPNKWMGEMIQTFDANKKDFIPQWQQHHPEFKHIMRLQKNDLVAMNMGDNRCVMRLCKIDGTSAIHFALHSESNVPSRTQELKAQNKYKQASVSTLQTLNTHKVHISPSGLWREQDIK